MVNATYARALVTDAWLNRGTGTLLGVIKKRHAESMDGSRDGTFVTGTSGNGISMSQLSGQGCNPKDIAETWQEIYERYAVLQVTYPPATQGDSDIAASEALIFPALLAGFRSMTGYLPDWRGLVK